MIYAIVILGFFVLILLLAAAYTTRLAVFPPRQALSRDPSSVEIPFEELNFQAQDGVHLSGWFIPASKGDNAKSPGVVIVHGWPWNRIGSDARPLHDLPKASPVDLMPLAKTIHDAGISLLMFDLRNHGKSEAARPMSMGWMESLDVLAALDVLAGREEIDENQISVVGFSLGGNAVLYALPYYDGLCSAMVVQPMTPTVFSAGFGKNLLGPLWVLVGPLTSLFYRILGGMQYAFVDPIRIARGFGKVPVLFVQGSGDKWGSAENVAEMVAATPNAVEPIFPETTERYGGYKYVLGNPDMVVDFLKEHLPR